MNRARPASMRRVLPRRRAGDQGFALVTVLIAMVVVTGVLLTATAVSINAMGLSRRAQDYQAALEAAQAGIDDYLARLNDCDSYWSAPCSGSPAEVAKDAWARVPGSTSQSIAQYKYHLIATPATVGGLLRLKVWGRVNNVTRALVVDFRKASFLNYIYYTDYEAVDPAFLTAAYPSRTEWYGGSVSYDGQYVQKIQSAGIPATSGSYNASLCGHHYYADGSTAGRASRPNPAEYLTLYRTTDSYVASGSSSGTLNTDDQGNWGHSCDINFVGGDVVNGPLYTKDAMLLLQLGGTNPKFLGKTETYWQTNASPANTAAHPYRANGSGSAPDPAGAITIAKQSVDLPPSNAALRDAAVSGGCLFKGPTRLLFQADGSVLVTSPRTTNPGPKCTKWRSPGPQTAVPGNGVIYVDPGPAANCTGNPGEILGTYPVAGDVTKYSCTDGDAFVQGTVNGRYTVGADHDIVVTGNTVYNSGTAATSGDVLGLIANGNVEVYHPVTCRITVPTGTVCPDTFAGSGPWANSGGYYDNITGTNGTLSSIEIDAAILSVNHSFTVQNYWRAPQLTGKLKVVGGIYQRFRGPVGTSTVGGTGYLKDYQYDSRLQTLSPPYFLNPVDAAWGEYSVSEATP